MYPGGKNTSYQKIVNLIPPHETYIETHLGSGAIMRHKRPSALSIGLDLNESVLRQTQQRIEAVGVIATNSGASASLQTTGLPGRYEFLCVDAVGFLTTYQFTGDEFVYLDPPYLMRTRRQQRPLYQFEYTDDDHELLLSQVKGIPCPAMISGYWSEMYADHLAGWYTHAFQSQTRGGSMATEWLWMNYSEPKRLHDYRYLGDNFRERERIKRKRQRWAKKLAGLDVLEQRAILWAIEDAGLLA